MKQQVTVVQGLMGSGKSTWALEFMKQNPNWVRVNRDALRRMRGEYWLPTQEDLITDWEVNSVKSALDKGYNVIIDACHLDNKYIKAWKKTLENYKITVNVKAFNVTLAECIARDKNRLETVGEKVITDKFTRYIAGRVPFQDDSFDITPFKVAEIKQDVWLRKAIICDLDGTLCIHHGRSPYEYDKCDTDIVNKPVRDILQNFYESHIIIYLSGREDVCKDKTLQWLDDNNSWFCDRTKLYMRKAGDMRDDRIVKSELFLEHINNKYHVDFVLDDRDKVVKMWRDLGLTCLQVAPGDF